MADLKPTERMDIERALRMASGYVLNFSDRTFYEFVLSSVGIDIYNGQYEDGGTSKANHLRSFWRKEPNYIVGCLLYDLLIYAKKLAPRLPSPWLSTDRKQAENYDRLLEDCLLIAERLKRDVIVENIDALKPNTDDRDFALLAKSIRESIEKNEPHVALDRLHTFCVKYFRSTCAKHGLSFDKDEPLNNIFGKYVKYLEASNIVEAKISIRILKTSITILSDFNDVRNNKSFAHDNRVINYQEALLIFSNVTNTIKFIEHIEGTHVI